MKENEKLVCVRAPWWGSWPVSDAVVERSLFWWSRPRLEAWDLALGPWGMWRAKGSVSV